MQRRVDRTWNLIDNRTTERQCSKKFEREFKANYYANDNNQIVVCIDDAEEKTYNAHTVRYLTIDQGLLLEMLIEIRDGRYVVPINGDKYQVFTISDGVEVEVASFFHEKEAMAIQSYTCIKALETVLKGHSIVKQSILPYISIKSGSVDYYVSNNSMESGLLYPVDNYIIIPPLYNQIVGVNNLRIFNTRVVHSLQSRKKEIKWSTAAMLKFVFKYDIGQDMITGTEPMVICHKPSSCNFITKGE